jgi:hypothetical protein
VTRKDVTLTTGHRHGIRLDLQKNPCQPKVKNSIIQKVKQTNWIPNLGS